MNSLENRLGNREREREEMTGEKYLLDSALHDSLTLTC